MVRRTLPCALCLVFFVVLFQGCESFTKGRHEPKVDDRSIVESITALILEDRSVNASEVRVFAQEGKVTLSGTVPNDEAKSRLLAKARKVKGVKSVSDNLEVATHR